MAPLVAGVMYVVILGLVQLTLPNLIAVEDARVDQVAEMTT